MFRIHYHRVISGVKNSGSRVSHHHNLKLINPKTGLIQPLCVSKILEKLSGWKSDDSRQNMVPDTPMNK